MDKGWGLTLDSDSGYSKRNSSSLFSGERMFSGIEFPVKPRAVVDEVDFFSDKKVEPKSNNSNTSITVKKENCSSAYTVNTGLHLVIANNGSDQSTMDDEGISTDQADNKRELAQLQVELQRMNAENQRLKEMLGQVTNNYNSLQMHLVAIMQQQQQNQAAADQASQDHVQKPEDKKQEIGSSRGLVPIAKQFLNLGTKPETEVSNSSSEARTRSDSAQNNGTEAKNSTGANNNGKRVGRDESPESHGWAPPNKVNKANSPPPKQIDQATEATMRKARVSVRARSEAPMISDGCQWRKYGQKMAKGNPCPRAYYRCTMAVGCPVRKQVQRCAEDRTILITTYEGNHNHPLPPAAMAMASTTTAAASMLLSGSMSSADGIMNPNSLLARAILPCSSSSVATISASAPFPTVTLDLTTSPVPLPFQRSQQTQFQVPFPGQPQNFGSSNSQLPQVFGQALYNQSKFSGLQLSQELVNSTQLTHQAQQQQSQPSSFADTVSAATAAITADPTFTAALAAAITSIISGSHPNNNSSTTSNNSNGTTNNHNNNNSFPGN